MSTPRETFRKPSQKIIQTISPALPGYSSRMYLQLAPDGISLLKFLLEAEDNLAYLSTVSPHRAVVKLVFAPGREREVREFLETVRLQVAFQEVVMFQGEEKREKS
jgi:hypothetical protein